MSCNKEILYTLLKAQKGIIYLIKNKAQNVFMKKKNIYSMKKDRLQYYHDIVVMEIFMQKDRFVNTVYYILSLYIIIITIDIVIFSVMFF